MTSQDTFGLGTSTVPEDAINTKYDFLRFYEAGYRRLYRSLYLGAGLLYNRHSSVKADEEFEPVWSGSPYVTYSQARGFDLESQSSAGTSVSVLFDSRDGTINPSRGVYAGVEYQTFDDERVAGAIAATGRQKLIFAGISLEVCAAFPAITAIAKGLGAYVAVDASGTFSETGRVYIPR